MNRNCENCNFSQLKPCPLLLTTCGPDRNHIKWTEKKTTTPVTKFKSKLDPRWLFHSEDIVEETTRKTMMERKKAERPLMQLKVTVFIVLVVLGFLVIFVFKFMRFVNHTLFAVVALGILLVVLWRMINRKWVKK